MGAKTFYGAAKKALTHFSSSDSLGSVLMEVDVLKSCHFTSDKQIVNSTSAVGQFSVSAKKHKS